MAEVKGLTGLRPAPQAVSKVTCPPYDVIKPGSPLEGILKDQPDSLYHVILGDAPEIALKKMQESGALQPDEEPCFYVYRQRGSFGSRLGVFSAVAVDDYSKGNVVRHEKTFDDKVQGRIRLARKTGYTTGPIFLLTASPIQDVLESVVQGEPVYAFTSDFGGYSDLHDLENEVYRVPQDSEPGKALAAAIGKNPLYIADGHHRYHAALLNGQSHTLAYIVQKAEIQAYNRVIRGKVPIAEAKNKLDLQPVKEFKTPAKHSFCIYTRDGVFEVKAGDVPQDVVGRLDCSLLERDVYPHLGVTHDMILDSRYFDYYAESELDTMKAQVDKGKYDLAVALHPVSIEELMAVANAGLKDPEVVMPEKSTFFSPKILTGLFLYRF